LILPIIGNGSPAVHLRQKHFGIEWGLPFAEANNNMLPPDNFQEDPKSLLAPPLRAAGRPHFSALPAMQTEIFVVSLRNMLQRWTRPPIARRWCR
jgi:hypothetical protein